MLQNTKRNSYNDSVALKDALRRCNFAEISLIVDCLYWAVQRDVKVLREGVNDLGVATREDMLRSVELVILVVVLY